MGGKQLGFSVYELTTAKKQTKREKFLAELEMIRPWAAVIALIETHYPKASKKGGRAPYPLATTLRIHLLLQWYSLSDPAMEEALIEVPTMHRFAGIERINDRIPDETKILTFRHLLEKHDLGEQIFETVKAHLSERGMTMYQGTIIDATLIATPSSTKNKEGKRDAEMHQPKKGNQPGLIQSMCQLLAPSCCHRVRWQRSSLVRARNRNRCNRSRSDQLPQGDP